MTNKIAIGKVSKKALEKGKVKPVVKQSVSRKIASKKKADRTVKGLRANRAAPKAAPAKRKAG